MGKHEFRSVMKHFYLKKTTAAQIKDQLNYVHKRVRCATIGYSLFLHNEFTLGRTFTKDEVNFERPMGFPTKDIFEYNPGYHNEGRRVKERDC